MYVRPDLNKKKKQKTSYALPIAKKNKQRCKISVLRKDFATGNLHKQYSRNRKNKKLENPKRKQLIIAIINLILVFKTNVG